MRGTIVIARGYADKAFVMRVWDWGKGLIYLSSDSQFQQLSTGQSGLIPVGFPSEDVFAYDAKAIEGMASGSLDWSSLRRFDALSRQDQDTICVK